MTTAVPPGPFRPGTLLDSLRTATRARHDALEQAVDLLGPRCSTARYARFLRGTLAVVAALEPPVVATLGDLVRPPGRASRADRIRHDLRVLGVDSDNLPGIPSPAIDGTPDALGAAYVLQGSLLGGTVIVPALLERTRVPEAATTYLRLFGHDTGRAWREFAVALDGFAAGAADAARARVLDRAAATFEAFAVAFAREGLST